MKVKIGSVATVWRWKWVWGEPAPKGQLGRQSLCIDMGVAGAATPPKKAPAVQQPRRTDGRLRGLEGGFGAGRCFLGGEQSPWVGTRSQHPQAPLAAASLRTSILRRLPALSSTQSIPP